MTKYRYNIGLDKYAYGEELEFATAPLQTLKESFEKTAIPFHFLLEHKEHQSTYDKNYLDLDSTVSYREKENIYGGEISSRLYHGQTKDWEEIEQTCAILKENGARINGHCSNHVSIDLSPVQKKNRFIKNLSLVVARYEPQLETYYMGEKYMQRQTKKKYASSISIPLSSAIEYMSLKDREHDFEWEVDYILLPLYPKHAGINLKNVSKTGRMEIRYANGTLNEKVVQNNINFSLKLVDAIEEDKFDWEELTSQVVDDYHHQEKDYHNVSEQDSYQRFLHLASLIATSSEDMDDFMGQYEKVLSTKPKR